MYKRVIFLSSDINVENGLKIDRRCLEILFFMMEKGGMNFLMWRWFVNVIEMIRKDFYIKGY